VNQWRTPDNVLETLAYKILLADFLDLLGIPEPDDEKYTVMINFHDSTRAVTVNVKYRNMP
jgi:hypothetical protein